MPPKRTEGPANSRGLRVSGPNDETRAAERLDVRVAREFQLSRRQAQDAIGAGQVDVGANRVREAGRQVLESERISFDRNRKREERIRYSVPVLHEDEALLVVDKPAGLLSVPTDGAQREDTVLSRVRDDLRHVRGVRAYAGALHRLDRGTSGLLAIALSKDCHAAGRDLFRRHEFTRRYLALVEGAPKAESGVIDLPIADEYQDGARHIATDDDEPARDARTRFRVIERLQRAALLELELETGRQHQIRLHLRATGHPIVGDGVYGSARRGDSNRPFLHASFLSFPHPLTRASIECRSDPPDDFERALSRLRGSLQRPRPRRAR